MAVVPDASYPWERGLWDTLAPSISDPQIHPVWEPEMEPVSERETPSISEPETHPVRKRLFVQIAASRELRRTPSRTVRRTPSRGARRNSSGGAKQSSHRLPVWCSETHLLAPHISCPEMPVLGPSVSQCEAHSSRRARCVRSPCDGSDGADHGDDDEMMIIDWSTLAMGTIVMMWWGRYS